MEQGGNSGRFWAGGREEAISWERISGRKGRGVKGSRKKPSRPACKSMPGGSNREKRRHQEGEGGW